MKKIKIFLASSIVDLEVDRVKVGDFIRQLNEIYFDRGIHFSLIKCDDYDNAIVNGGKQAEFDREIQDSELCFFLFFRKVGDYTRHEFDVALSSYKNTNKPKIVTYFKYVTKPEDATADVKAFMQMLDGEIKHYYNVYQSIDTLKLGILMQIKLMQLDAEEPRVENGKVIFGNSEIADINQIPLFTGNQSLNMLRENLAQLTAQYLNLREQCISNPDDEGLYEQFATIASEKADVENKIRLTEKAVLEASKIMLEKTAKGNLSPRQVAAYHALDQGDYTSALEILDIDAIMLDLSHNEDMAEGYLERIQINVDELLQRIEVLTAKGINKDNAAEIKSIYQTVYERVEKYNLNKAPLMNYVVFLSHQNDLSGALAVAKQLEYHYQNPQVTVDDEKKASLYLLLGGICNNTQRYDEGEELYEKALAIYKQLAQENPETFLPGLSDSYADFAVLQTQLKRFEQAEKMYMEALAIRKKLAETNPALYEERLAMVNNNIGYLYVTLQRFDEGEKYYLEGLKIYEKLVTKDAENIEPLLAQNYNNLGLLYTNLRRFDDAIQAFLKARDIYLKLVNKNPDAYEPTLAMIYNNMSIVYLSLQRYPKAEDVSFKALDIYERLVKGNPDAFEPSILNSYINLGNMYVACQMIDEALDYFTKALDTAQRLAGKNPEAFNPYLATVYNNLGMILNSIPNNDAAEIAYREAIEIYEELVQKNAESAEAFESNLAMAYGNLGAMYLTMEEIEDAEEMLVKSAALFEKCVGTKYEAIASNLALCYCNLGSVYIFLGKEELAEDKLLKAVAIYQDLAQKFPSAFEPGLAMAYLKMGSMYIELKDDEEEAEYYLEQAYKLARRYKETSLCAPIYMMLKELFEEE